jgi:HlyD family secretion protein
VRVSEARVEVARAALERTVLRAPFDGTVAEVNGEVGEFATPSPIGVPTLPAVDIVDDSCLYVTAPIDEVDAPDIRAGMPARISLDAFANRHFPGTVRRVAPYVLELEKQARTVEVEVEFNEPEEGVNLLAGYSADAEVVLATRENVLRLPTEALLEGQRVLVYRAEDGKLEAREIKTGISNWEYTEVLSGLREGEVVVTSVDREGVEDGVYATPEENKSNKP